MATPKPKIKDHPAIPPSVKQTLVMPSQNDSVAADVATIKDDFNALLAKLRTAGYIDS
ncbi:MAG: Head fiber protein [Anaerocolumna sp.]|jgi:hypothetical protein|nr:Head fiber protein [Anaerocolumna sp.]